MVTGPNKDDASLDTRHALAVRARAQVGARREATQALATTGVGVLDRTVRILDAVERGARSLTAIQRETGLTRSTTHRLVRALEDHGLLFHVGGRGYALGPRLLGLAARAMRELPLRELARPALERLARTTGESAQLFVREGSERLCVDAAESDAELRTIVSVGSVLPLTKGSAGKVFLAWGTTEGLEIDEALARQIRVTRRRGWADSHGEREHGVASVSAPVFSSPTELLAAVSVSGPQSRLSPLRAKRYAPAVVEAAREIERAVGAEPASDYQA
ncbi:MAG: IclR family transcriptional regulator [Actinomycetota bacterium]